MYQFKSMCDKMTVKILWKLHIIMWFDVIIKE